MGPDSASLSPQPELDRSADISASRSPESPPSLGAIGSVQSWSWRAGQRAPTAAVGRFARSRRASSNASRFIRVVSLLVRAVFLLRCARAPIGFKCPLTFGLLPALVGGNRSGSATTAASVSVACMGQGAEGFSALPVSKNDENGNSHARLKRNAIARWASWTFKRSSSRQGSDKARQVEMLAPNRDESVPLLGAP